MNTTLRSKLTTTTLVLTLLITPACLAQAPSITTPVAVVDIGYIFKNHPRFAQAMDRVKAEVKASEEELLIRRKDIEARVKKLQSYKPNSLEHKKLEAETARLQAQLQADMTIKRKGFLEKEAKVYHAIYQEIQNEVKAFADNQRIGLVLRFSSEQIDPMNRQSVLQGVNRPVIYQRNLNISYDILDRLQRPPASTSQAFPRSSPDTARRTTTQRTPRR